MVKTDNSIHHIFTCMQNNLSEIVLFCLGLLFSVLEEKKKIEVDVI